MEGSHELVVRAVAERLGLVADRGGVIGGIAGAFLGESASEDLLGGPGIDGVGGRLDLEHSERDVFGDALRGVAPAVGRGASSAERCSVSMTSQMTSP